MNATIAAGLWDLALVQTQPEKRRAYGRAASAIFALEQPIDTLLGGSGALPRIAAVGPSSARIVMEVLVDGRSPTVDQAVALSAKARDVENLRRQRANFFSRAEALRLLREHGDPAVLAGDLQVHSTWSDGASSLTDLAAAGMARGYSYLGITDHSGGQRIPRGMSAEAISQRRATIARLNTEHAGRFHLLDGVEANIFEDGSLDITGDDARAFEIVLAAPHSGLRRAEDQTARMVRAVERPGVHILAHPRGRQIGARAGIMADWARVFAAAAHTNVAVEIDGDPSRQDLDYRLAREALAAGCLFALDSDAHATGEFWYADMARAHAALAGIPSSRIVNTWPLERLRDWLRWRNLGARRQPRSRR